MNFISTDNLNSIIAEITDFCNAACPMCNRFDWDLNLKSKVNKNHLLLPFFKDRIGSKIIKQLKNFIAGGTYGDGSVNPDCLEIFDFIKTNNNKCNVSLLTNGGARNTEFWQELGKLKIHIIFAIDGLEDTNHLYRRNVKWGKLMDNVNAFISAGGKATWEFIVFKHNENQLEEAKTLSKKLKFNNFTVKYTGRWSDFNDEGVYRNVDKIKVDNYYIEKPISQGIPNNSSVHKEKNIKIDQKIICKAFSNNKSEIYIRANGLVSPCCWLGDIEIHEASKLIKDFKSVNLNYSSLHEIINSEFFKKVAEGIYNLSSHSRLKTCVDCCGVSA